MSKVFTKPKSMADVPMHYCPGCGHGIVHRLIAECLDEAGAAGNAIGIAPVGCAVFAYRYYKCDFLQAAHGRAPAVATGVKRARPDSLVFAYQGDGDFASIGAAESLHAAARGEHITLIFINNGIYGMTGGQMAPTTLMGQKTSTSQSGRTAAQGYPIKVSEIYSQLSAPGYIARTSVHDVKNVLNTKKAIAKGFEVQKAKKGFSLIEILTGCPTNFHITPQQSLDFIKDAAIKEYPLGTFKDVTL